MALRVAILFLVLATPAAVYATNYTVGDANGWNTGVDYTKWVQGKTFNTGDTLNFNYGSSHGVDVVSQADYSNCNTGNALQTFSQSPTSITLQAGSMYFICPTPGHCQQGMKLAITVQGAGSPSGSPSSTPPTPPSNSPPSPNGSSAAPGGFGSINHLMLGFSLVFAALFVRV